MANKPENVEWAGFTEAQGVLLGRIKFYGNNDWARTSQLSELMPRLLAPCSQEGLSADQIIEAMKSAGFSPQALHQLESWENKRLNGKFGK